MLQLAARRLPRPCQAAVRINTTSSGQIDNISTTTTQLGNILSFQYFSISASDDQQISQQPNVLTH